MRKRLSLILVLLLGVILVVSLVACNKNVNNQVPDEINPPDASTEDVSALSLKFSFPIEMSSVFNSIYIDEFDLERYVEYSVVYRDSSDAVVREVPYGGVRLDMVKTEDQPLLKQRGHHTIHVTDTLENGTKVSGTFDLHLKDRSGALTLVGLTFNLKDSNNNGTAHAFFGTIDNMRATATVNVESGVTFKTWYEFFDTFRMGLSGKALECVSASTDNGNVVLKPTGEGFPFTIESGMIFNTYWTDNVVKITYELGVPEEAVLMTGKPDPEALFKGDGKYANVTALRGAGRILQPEDGEINVYNGYYFAGWFNKADDTLWRFSSAVGDDDITLYAKWVAAEYSFTLYTMGGRFVSGLKDAIDKDTGKTITVANASELGYTLIESTSRFALSTGEINCLTFTGFHYGVNYDKYVAVVQLDANGQNKVLLKFSDIYSPNKENPIFEKGDGDYIILEDLYNDYQCTDPLIRKDVVDAEQPVTYIKWVFHEPDQEDPNYDSLFLQRISKMYTELIFRPVNGIKGWTVMGDGSVRIDQIAEWALNELIVPATIIIDGEVRPITEIDDGAVSNVKALTKVDLSRASNLTTIGAQAFALDTYLKEIIYPEDNAIANIGDNAFMGTDYENNYYKNTGGAEFIVINKMIYKYVGPDKAIIDLSNPASYYNSDNAPNMSANDRRRYNSELSKIETIEDGAFENCKSLASITLPRQITSIADYAFANLTHFKTLNLQEDSKLVSIGASAFDNSLIVSENSELYNDTYKAILIGSVYYRFLDKSAKSAVIPASNGEFAITHIASKAFTGCDALEEVGFEKEDQILYVGSDAFIETTYIRMDSEGDPYTEINGILTAFYGPTNTTELNNLIVPNRVSTIATNAFGQYAQYFSTVQINGSVKEIQSYAFSGASRLTSVIFPDVSVDKNKTKLLNAPVIGDNAFSNSRGELPNKLFLYFSKDVIDLFNALSANPSVVADEATRAWLSLYQLHTGHFIAEDISLVEIDSSVISKTLLHINIAENEEDRTEANAYIDKYGKDEIIENALIITSNTGIKRTASLGWTQNAMQFIAVEPTGKYASLYEEGVNKFVLTYQYNGKTTGCPTEANDPHLFVVTVYDAIKDYPAFNSSEMYKKDGNVISMHGKNESNSNFWLEGLDGQVTGSIYPTFYTSADRTEIVKRVRLCYVDIHGNKHELAPSSIDGFNPNAVSTEISATLTFDFYGLGRYVLNYTYSVVQSKFERMEQTGPIIIPINGNTTTYFRNYYIDLIGQDGKREPKALTSSNFTVVAVGEDEFGNMNENVTIPDTSKLGLRKMRIKYVSPDTLNPNGMTLEVCYAVVLEADASLFGYEIINGPGHYARIISCSSRNVETIVVPSKCTYADIVGHKTGNPEIDDVEYDIVQIGYFQDSPNGVFENFANLRTIYLPESIQRLGVNTFAGCARLTGVYTSIQSSDSTPVVIPMDKKDVYFTEKVDENGNVVSYVELDGNGTAWTVIPVELNTFDGLEYDNELVIAGDYVVNDTNHIKYRVVSIKHEITVDKSIRDMDIYLPDTMYNKIVIFDKDGTRFNSLHDNVHLYTSGSDFMFKTVNRMPSELTEIKNGVFRGCEQLTHLDFSQATELNIIGAMAFAESGLQSIDFSSNKKLVEINNQLFANATLLKEVKLHSEVKAIGGYAFYGCKMLESVTGYGVKLTHIGFSAFSQCRSLTEIHLYSGLVTRDPNGIENVESNAFTTCGALTVYCHFDESELSNGNCSWNSNWKDITTPVVWNCDTNETAKDGFIYFVNPSDGLRYALNTANMTATVAGQMLSLSGEIVIPETVSYKGETYTITAIGKNAFDGNDKITRVTITSKVKTIDAYAFKNCTSLELFRFVNDENGLTTVISTAFQGCNKLVQRPTVNTTIN